ncbi:hypothetical protein G6F40_013649 [Rhizopus arrhizus]|nr:hypothetical protein G6F40_013649 [Rhizopus arrhizus]
MPAVEAGQRMAGIRIQREGAVQGDLQGAAGDRLEGLEQGESHVRILPAWVGGLGAASMPRTPPQPDPPRLRQFPAICRCWCGWWVSTLVDTVDPRHAWMNLHRNRIF